MSRASLIRASQVSSGIAMFILAILAFLEKSLWLAGLVLVVLIGSTLFEHWVERNGA